MPMYYVSQTATNGYAIGSDTNDGLSKGTPFLTLDKAISMVAGSTIIFNDGAYISASIPQFSKSLILRAENPSMVSIGGTNAIRAVYMTSAAGDIDVTFDGIVVDARSLSQSCISFAVSANKYTLQFLNAELTGGTVNLIEGQAAVNLDLIVRGLTLSGSPTQNGIGFTGIATGLVDIDGVTVNLTNQVSSASGAIIIKATAAGLTASVKNVIGAMTLNAASGSHYGVHIQNIPSAVIEHCEIDITGGTGVAAAYNYVISAHTTPLDTNNGVIRYNKGINGAPGGGILALIGTDSSDPADPAKNRCNNGQIYGNDMQGLGQTGLHGYMLGNSTGGSIVGNKAQSVAYLAICKGQADGVAHHNIGIDIYSIGSLRTKAAVNCKFYNNTVLLSGGYFQYAGSDLVTGLHSTGIQFANNIGVATGAIIGMTFVEPSNTATFDSSQYFSEIALPPNPWYYDGTYYATFAEWQSAIEATAQYGDPLLTADFKLTAGSPCIGGGVDVGLLYGWPVDKLPDIGALEYYPRPPAPLISESEIMPDVLSVTSRSFIVVPGGIDATHDTPTALVVQSSVDGYVWSTTDTVDFDDLIDLFDGSFQLIAPNAPVGQSVRIFPANGTLFSLSMHTYAKLPGVFSITWHGGHPT